MGPFLAGNEIESFTGIRYCSKKQQDFFVYFLYSGNSSTIKARHQTNLVFLDTYEQRGWILGGSLSWSVTETDQSYRRKDLMDYSQSR